MVNLTPCPSPTGRGELEAPVFDGAGQAVVGFDVGLGNFKVAQAHFERGVAEDFLEGVDVSAVAQKVDCKSVTKPVRVHVGNAGALADEFEGVVEVVVVETAIAGGGEEVIVGGGIGPSGEVAPEM